jgi:hypothetical protein
VGSRALDYGAETDDRVYAALSELIGDDRDFVRAGNAHQSQIRLLAAHADKSVDRALDELLGQETVEAADDESDFTPARYQISGYFFHLPSFYNFKQIEYILPNTSSQCQKPGRFI